MMNMNAAKGSQSSANDYGMGQQQQQRPMMPIEPSQEQARGMGYGGEQQVAMSMAGKGMSGMNNNNGMNLGAYMSSMMKPQMQANSYQSPMMNNGANKNGMYGGDALPGDQDQHGRIDQSEAEGEACAANRPH